MPFGHGGAIRSLFGIRSHSPRPKGTDLSEFENFVITRARFVWRSRRSPSRTNGRTEVSTRDEGYSRHKRLFEIFAANLHFNTWLVWVGALNSS